MPQATKLSAASAATGSQLLAVLLLCAAASGDPAARFALPGGGAHHTAPPAANAYVIYYYDEESGRLAESFYRVMAIMRVDSVLSRRVTWSNERPNCTQQKPLDVMRLRQWDEPQDGAKRQLIELTVTGCRNPQHYERFDPEPCELRTDSYSERVKCRNADFVRFWQQMEQHDRGHRHEEVP